jgi:hypothetical protein
VGLDSAAQPAAGTGAPALGDADLRKAGQGPELVRPAADPAPGRESGGRETAAEPEPGEQTGVRKILFVAWRDLANRRAGGSEVLVDRLAAGMTARGDVVRLLAAGH